MLIKFWGTRGSIPVPGKNTLKYGGNTPCVEVRTKDNKLIILDAGSGLRELGNKLEDVDGDEINIFISHYHWDHIQGIPFFRPMYENNKKVIFYGMTSKGLDIENILGNQMNDNYFPIKIDEVNAKVDYKKIEANQTYKLDGISIDTFQANHSSPTLAYKLSEGNKCFIYLTDNELKYDNRNPESIKNIEELNKDLISFCKGCDYLIHDTMYDESQLLSKKGWGHSSNVLLAYFSILSEIKNLILFHFNPDYTDEKIDRMLNETKEVFSKERYYIGCMAASEGLEISL
jgi:phosphoribosyl 1,2-cyclic phosphodiesterase